ncbi:MAG: hypothetical protein ACTSU5_03050 [Promethearchaeota archaeon]
MDERFPGVEAATKAKTPEVTEVSTTTGKIVQESPILSAEALMGSFIAGYLKEPPKLEDSTWENDKPVWQIRMEFENTPHDACFYTRIVAPAPAGFEGRLGSLQRLRFLLRDLKTPASVRYVLYERNKWHFESPDRTLSDVLNEGDAFKNARKLELERTLSKGEVQIKKRVDEPIKTWVDEEGTTIQVLFYENLENAYLAGQEIAQRLRAIYSGSK